MASILLIEDDEFFADNVEAVLTVKLGCEVDWCIYGAEALKKFEAREFDIVLLDGKLPDFSGLDLLKKLMEIRANARIVMMTGINEVDILEALLDAGAEDILKKPFLPAQLVERVKLLLSGITVDIK